jgi:hypothetical protein
LRCLEETLCKLRLLVDRVGRHVDEELARNACGDEALEGALHTQEIELEFVAAAAGSLEEVLR